MKFLHIRYETYSDLSIRSSVNIKYPEYIRPERDTYT